jgi:hypothetical protein
VLSRRIGGSWPTLDCPNVPPVHFHYRRCAPEGGIFLISGELAETFQSSCPVRSGGGGITSGLGLFSEFTIHCVDFVRLALDRISQIVGIAAHESSKGGFLREMLEALHLGRLFEQASLTMATNNNKYTLIFMLFLSRYLLGQAGVFVSTGSVLALGLSGRYRGEILRRCLRP